MINLVTQDFKIDNYLIGDSAPLNYAVNFVNWFQVHNEQEKLAMNICNQMKINIIPTYVQLARIFEDLFEKQNQIFHENEFVFDCSKLSDINHLLGRLLEDFKRKYSSNTTKLNPAINLQPNSPLKGLLSRPDFKNRKWMKIFNICELAGCKILYSMITFLDTNLFVGANITLRQHIEMADYFFGQNLQTFISEYYKEVNYIIIKNRYRSFMRWPFKKLIKYIIKFICFLSIVPAIYLRSLTNTITDQLFDLFQKELKHLNLAKPASKNLTTESEGERINLTKKMNQFVDNLKTKGDATSKDKQDNEQNEPKISNENASIENRFHLVVGQARVSVADFCVHCLKALTSTLFHFWVIKEPLTDSDIDVLNEYKEIFKGIQDDVHSALHKYILSTQLRLRPYGFIMNSALIDNLPSDKWKRGIRNEMRLWLQESISLFLIWNIEFITVYPRPIQAQYTKMSLVSNLYQSMIESLIDFKVILVLANQLNEQVSQCFYDDKTLADPECKKLNKKPKFFKTNFDPSVQLPWTLIKYLEMNFVCKKIDFKLNQTIRTRILPSILIKDFQGAVVEKNQMQPPTKNVVKDNEKDGSNV